VAYVALTNTQPPTPPTSKAGENKAADDTKPYFLPIKDGGKIPRVDYDYHDALKNTWEGLKVRQFNWLTHEIVCVCMAGRFRSHTNASNHQTSPL
jgi:hypothetical protein